jgi:hypothetical protein
MPSLTRLLSWVATALLAQAVCCYGLDSGIAVLSPQFLDDYKTASEASSTSKSAQPFIDLLSKYEAGNERAELEVTLGMIYNQRSGLVDHGKAVEYFTKALDRDLPEQTSSKILLLRGNSQEQQKNLAAARDDYFRGLLVCSYRDFSGGWPEIASPNMPFSINSGDPAEMEGARDYRQYRRQIAHQRFLLQQRYFLIEAIRRITKPSPLSQEEVTEILKRLSPDSSRYEIIQTWLKSENPRPWP